MWKETCVILSDARAQNRHGVALKTCKWCSGSPSSLLGSLSCFQGEEKTVNGLSTSKCMQWILCVWPAYLTVALRRATFAFGLRPWNTRGGRKLLQALKNTQYQLAAEQSANIYCLIVGAIEIVQTYSQTQTSSSSPTFALSNIHPTSNRDPHINLQLCQRTRGWAGEPNQMGGGRVHIHNLRSGVANLWASVCAGIHIEGASFVLLTLVKAKGISK